MDTEDLLAALERAEREDRPLETGGLRFTSLSRVMWPGRGYTKGDLVRYYVQVARVMLRYLDDRPLMLKRYHTGVGGRPVVQQRASVPAPDGVRTASVPTAQGERTPRYIGAEATLLYAAQMNAVEIHPWHSRLASPDRPDWVVLDLDPSYGAGFKKVVRIARLLRDHLAALGLTAAVKTSGSRGLHLYVPTGGAVDYAAAAELARLLAERVARDEPSIATVTRAVKGRGRRVYVDHLQNARGKTAVAPYSVRARPGAPVSVPLAWEEVDDVLDPAGISMTEVPARLERVGDPWARALEHRGDVRVAVERLRR